MRTGTMVIVAYLLCVLVSSVWRLLPVDVVRASVPDVVALTAAYLGLTARRGIAPAVAGAVILGYLGDLISGAPVGLQALAAGLSCLLAFSLNRRILVRGLAITLGFSAFVGGAAALLILILRVMNGITAASPAVELARVVGVAISTGAVGPLVLRLFRRVDATFARTQREREATLGGISPS